MRILAFLLLVSSLFAQTGTTTQPGGGGGGGSGTVAGATGNLAGFTAPTVAGNAPATFSGNNLTLAPSGQAIGSDTFSGVYVDGTRFTNLCAALAFASGNTTRRARVYDFNQYEAWTKDPFNDATCGNFATTGVSPQVFLGMGNFINGTGGTIHIPIGVELYLGGRASENQLNTTTGCGTATPTGCVGTLIIAYNTASPFTGGNAMTCGGCTLLPINTPVIDFGATGSFGALIQGPGTVSCAGISGSTGVANAQAQEQSFLFHLAIVGCQAFAVDWNGAAAQNSWLDDLEIISGALTGATIGTPTAFIGMRIQINAPNRHYGNFTCNMRGTATTLPVTACVQVINSRGGRIHDIHYENSNRGVIVDGSSNVIVENINTSAASQDASTPVTMVHICAAASGAPCSSGNSSTNTEVLGLQRTSPNLTTNMIVDDVNSKTVSVANWTGQYNQNPPSYGAALNSAWTAGIGGSITPSGSGQITAISNWYGPGGQGLFAQIPALTGALTGGAFTTGTVVFVQITLSNALGESLASNETSINLNAGNNCASGTVCSFTVTAPTLLAGQTYTVYTSASTGTEKRQNASNACVNITTNCVVQAVGAGVAVPASNTTIAVNPPNLQTSECPAGVNPSIFLKDANGNYQTAGGIDTTTAFTNEAANGFIEFCRPVIFNMSKGLTPPSSNGLAPGSMVGNGVLFYKRPTSSTDTVAMQMEEDNLTTDNTTYSGQWLGLYAQVDINGTPTLGGGGVAGQVGASGARSNINLNNTGTIGAILFANSSAIFRNNALAQYSSCSSGCLGSYYGWIGNLQTGQTGSSEFDNFKSAGSDNGNDTDAGFVGFHSTKPTIRFGSYNYGILVDNFGTSGNDYGIGIAGVNAAGTPAGYNFLQGPTTFGAQAHNPAGVQVDVTGGSVRAPLYATTTNCAVNSASPAACVAAPAGAVVVPTTTVTYTVNTTAVTAASRIFLFPMSFAGNLPSAPTCVAPAVTSAPTISAISAGVSFTFALPSTTGQTCWQYSIVN